MSLTIAGVITVKNERNILRENLLYHHLLGVDQFYVFLDGTTDGTENTVQDLPFVRIEKSISPNYYLEHSHISELIKHHEQHHTARQCLNAYHAIHLAREAEIVWLISFDPDELLCPHINQTYPGHLKTLFSSIAEETEMVRFRVAEVVSRKLFYENVFREETLFKLPGARINQKIFDPINDRVINIPGFLGQSMGKSAVRTSLESKPNTVHKFVKIDGDNLQTEWREWLLHYNCFDFIDFIKKYKNFQHHPDTFISGRNIDYPRKLFRDMVNDPSISEQELSDYYKRWLIFSPDEVKRLSASNFLGIFPIKSKIMTVTAVQQLFTQLITRDG